LIIFGKILIVTNYIFILPIIRDLFFGYNYLMRHKTEISNPLRKVRKDYRIIDLVHLLYLSNLKVK